MPGGWGRQAARNYGIADTVGYVTYRSAVHAAMMLRPPQCRRHSRVDVHLVGIVLGRLSIIWVPAAAARKAGSKRPPTHHPACHPARPDPTPTGGSLGLLSSLLIVPGSRPSAPTVHQELLLHHSLAAGRRARSCLGGATPRQLLHLWRQQLAAALQTPSQGLHTGGFGRPARHCRQPLTQGLRCRLGHQPRKPELRQAVMGPLCALRWWLLLSWPPAPHPHPHIQQETHFYQTGMSMHYTLQAFVVCGTTTRLHLRKLCRHALQCTAQRAAQTAAGNQPALGRASALLPCWPPAPARRRRRPSTHRSPPARGTRSCPSRISGKAFLFSV